MFDKLTGFWMSRSDRCCPCDVEVISLCPFINSLCFPAPVQCSSDYIRAWRSERKSACDIMFGNLVSPPPEQPDTEQNLKGSAPTVIQVMI